MEAVAQGNVGGFPCCSCHSKKLSSGHPGCKNSSEEPHHKMCDDSAMAVVKIEIYGGQRPMVDPG